MFQNKEKRRESISKNDDTSFENYFNSSKIRIHQIQSNVLQQEKKSIGNFEDISSYVNNDPSFNNMFSDDEIRTLDNIFESSKPYFMEKENYNDDERDLKNSTNFSSLDESIKGKEKIKIENNLSSSQKNSLILQEKGIQLKTELEEKISQFELEIEEKKNELKKDYPEDIFVELMNAKKNDIQRSQRQLWFRYQNEKENLESDFQEKLINQEIYEDGLEDLTERFRKPYVKLNDELYDLQKEIDGQVWVVKRDLRKKIEKLELEIAQVKEKMKEILITTLNSCAFLQKERTENMAWL